MGQSRVMNENASKHMLNTFHISFVVKGHLSNHTRVLWHTFIQQNVVDANMNKWHVVILPSHAFLGQYILLILEQDFYLKILS